VVVYVCVFLQSFQQRFSFQCKVRCGTFRLRVAEAVAVDLFVN